MYYWNGTACFLMHVLFCFLSYNPNSIIFSSTVQDNSSTHTAPNAFYRVMGFKLSPCGDEWVMRKLNFCVFSTKMNGKQHFCTTVAFKEF